MKRKELLNVMKTSVKNVMEFGKAKALALSVMLATIMTSSKVYAKFGYSNMKESNAIMEQIISVVSGISSFVGAILLVSSLFVFIMAFKNEDVDGKHRGGMGLGVAIALLAFGTIVKLFLK